MTNDNNGDPPLNGPPEGEGRLLVLHLVSHASGELVEMMGRNAVAQLEGVAVDRRLWKFVRSLGLVPEILAEIANRPGVVLHSVADQTIRGALEEGCERLRVPCQFVLEPVISRLARYTGAPVRFRTAGRNDIDEEYYRRVEAMKYTIAHDDGVAADDLENADVILVGVSRATKTPTCMYLASRGVKAANVPLVPGVPLADSVLEARKPLVVGLTIDPYLLTQIRASRLRRLSEEQPSTYSEEDAVFREVLDAKRLFHRRRWPIIDVTNRSIEQTAAMILEKLRERTEAGDCGIC
jgi:hypothetical protein